MDEKYCRLKSQEYFEKQENIIGIQSSVAKLKSALTIQYEAFKISRDGFIQKVLMRNGYMPWKRLHPV